jgi:biotin carboxyl carrier protein
MSKYYIQIGDEEFPVQVTEGDEGTNVHLGDDPSAPPARVDFAVVNSSPSTGEGLYSIIADGKSYQVYALPTEEGYRLVMWRHRYDVRVISEREWRLEKVAPRRAAQTGKQTIKSPMPGLIKAVLVAEGDLVTAGQRLLVLEAMKMENEITASRAGRVTIVHVTVGTVVEGGLPLITLE